jgi:tetratricopeptide (TPR) repeat protein
MIGFKYKNANSRALLVVCLSLVIAACAQPLVESRQEEPQAVPKAVEPEPDSEELALEPVPSGPCEQLTAPLLYGVLLGEIAGQRGMLDVSGASYVEAARQSNDPRIAERALKICVYAKQPQLALQAARRWVELAPDNLEARQSLAVLALRDGNDQEAMAQFEYLLEYSSRVENANAYQSMLGLLAREPDKQRSLNIMQQLVALRPGDPEAHFAYARLAVHAENWPLAEEEVRRSLELRPDWTQALILQAQISLKQDKNEVARRQLEAAMQRNPDDADLRLAYARLLVDLEDFDAARDEYRRLLKQQPDDGQIVYSMALLALEANELDEANKLFEQLVELDYQTQQSYYYLGAIAEEQEKYERATRWYEKVEQGDHWIEVQIRIARIEAKTGDITSARERLRKLRLSDPGQAQRLFLVEGDILTQVDQYEEAYELYSRYLEIQPGDIEILYARSLVAERLDRLEQAERDLRTILEREPDNARALNALGYTLADRTDRYTEALGYIEKALAQTPDDPAVIDSMGWVLFRLGRFQEAREYLQKAYDMTEDAEIAAHLGEVMWAMGDKDVARDLWQKARKKSPDDPVLEDTLQRYSP